MSRPRRAPRPAPRSSSSSRGPSTGERIIRGSGRSSRPRTTAPRRTSASGRRGSHRPTSMTSRPGSSRRSTAVGSARRTSWPARTWPLRDAMRVSAAAAGRKPPRLSIPTVVLRIGSRLAPHAGGAFGLPPDLARDRAVRGRRHLLGQQRQGRDRARLRHARSGDRRPGCVRAGDDRDRVAATVRQLLSAPSRTLPPWPATSRCSNHPRTPTHTGRRCRRSRWVAAWPGSRRPMGPPPSAATRTGSGRGCRRARTTTT